MSRPTTLARWLTLVAALTLTTSTQLVVSSPSTAAAPRWKSCGVVKADLEVLAHHTSCTNARAVARARFNGRDDPRGFSCRDVAVEAGAGYFVACRKGAARVRVLPE
jgi:hypothetical protein